MTCAHEPEDRRAGEPTTCMHCRVEIEAAPCKRCGNGVAHWMEVGVSNHSTDAGKMACRHEPMEPVGPVTARHCRHCGAEIVPAACAECHGMEFVTDDAGRDIDCPYCNGTGCEGWRLA